MEEGPLLDQPAETFPMLGVLMGLSNAIDLVAPELHDHHKKVAYIAELIAAEIGRGAEERKNLVLAGILHDIGCLSVQERIKALEFERDFDLASPGPHPEVGYQLLKDYGPFSVVADLIRHHHLRWDRFSRPARSGARALYGSQILHLADRVSVLLLPRVQVPDVKSDILRKVSEQSGKMFGPELVEAFRSISSRRGFWMQVTDSSLDGVISRIDDWGTVRLDLDGLISLSRFFCRLIDFRSPYTASHASGVSATCSALSGLSGFSPEEQKKMEVAGFLHDLGKLAVPPEILDKPGQLTQEEFGIVKQHAYHTYRILEPLGSLQGIREWASLHHERMDGKGYPFNLLGKDIPIGGRIMAVADVFTALMEDRPYRRGLSPEQALDLIGKMAKQSALDPDVACNLEKRHDSINEIRCEAQEQAGGEYQEFRSRAGIPPTPPGH